MAAIRFPEALDGARAATNDFTFGGRALESVLGPGVTRDNCEILAILMDMEYDTHTNATVNREHVKNPRQIKFLNARMVSDPTQPGVGPDLVYRDPWGKPYIISMDLNDDAKCRDAFYSRKTVSQENGSSGFDGLVNATHASGDSDNYLFNGGVMVSVSWTGQEGNRESASQRRSQRGQYPELEAIDQFAPIQPAGLLLAWLHLWHSTIFYWKPKRK